MLTCEDFGTCRRSRSRRTSVIHAVIVSAALPALIHTLPLVCPGAIQWIVLCQIQSDIAFAGQGRAADSGMETSDFL